MKKLLIGFIGLTLLTACGQNTDQPTKDVVTEKNVVVQQEINVETTAETEAEEMEAEAAVETETTVELQKEEEVEAGETFSAEVDVETYVLDTAASDLFWKGITPVKSHEGTIAIESGSLTKTDANIAGEFVIDMTGMVVTDIQGPGAQGLVDHLENEDFFDVPNHPTAKFVITSSEKKSDTLYGVTGDLTMKAITNAITFDMTLEEADSLMASADFTIDRTRWGIEYNSGNFFKNLGDRIINDDMEIGFSLKFN